MAEHSHVHDQPAHGHHQHHDHSHADDSYYIDQLCMVGLSGAYGAICLSLYFWKTDMLGRLLGAQFHLFVLLSGIALTLLAFVRGAGLWSQAGKAEHEHAHLHGGHDHDVYDLELTEGRGALEHHHEHGECCNHDHAHHQHDHDHQHHDHSHADHDHGWAPWRYVVLLVPAILFMLGLPNKGPEVQAQSHSDVQVDFTKEAIAGASVIALGPPNLAMLTAAAGLQQESDVDVTALDFKLLDAAASDKERRKYWRNKTVEVRGQYAASPGSSHIFSLVRFRISCCAADTIQLDVPVVCRDEVTGLTRGDWIKVRGKIEFSEKDDKYTSVVLVPSRSRIEKCSPDLNPYIQ